MLNIPTAAFFFVFFCMLSLFSFLDLALDGWGASLDVFLSWAQLPILTSNLMERIAWIATEPLPLPG